MQTRILCLVIAIGCGGSKSAPEPKPETPAVDIAGLCADIDTLVKAAPGNFAQQKADGRVTVRGVGSCQIIHPSNSSIDDTVECELGTAGTIAASAAVLATWTPNVAGCTTVKALNPNPGPNSTQSWQHETKDNYLLEVRLDFAGEEPSVRPVLQIRRPEM